MSIAFPPGWWPRGQTRFHGNTPEVDDASTREEGAEYEIADLQWNSAAIAKPPRIPNAICKVRKVRNLTGATQQGKQMARMMKEAARPGSFYGRFDSLITAITDTPCYPIDEYLPSAGVVANDLCYVCVEGPSECITGLAADATNSIAAGAVVVGLVGSTTSAPTSGKIGAQISLGGATTPLSYEVQHALGRALSAKTTSQTSGAILVMLGKKYI
jgi:hypothetical protein